MPHLLNYMTSRVVYLRFNAQRRVRATQPRMPRLRSHFRLRWVHLVCGLLRCTFDWGRNGWSIFLTKKTCLETLWFKASVSNRYQDVKLTALSWHKFYRLQTAESASKSHNDRRFEAAAYPVIEAAKLRCYFKDLSTQCWEISVRTRKCELLKSWRAEGNRPLLTFCGLMGQSCNGLSIELSAAVFLKNFRRWPTDFMYNQEPIR